MENDVPVSAAQNLERATTPEAKVTRKAKSSVTPRTFNRFFAPRDRRSLKRNRGALKEIALSSINGQEPSARPGKFSTPLTPPATSTWGASQSSSIWPSSADDETPTKRIKIDKKVLNQIFEDSEGKDNTLAPITVQFVRRSKFRSPLGDTLRRQLGLSAGPQVKATFSVDPYSDTAGYYSRPEDIFICKDNSGYYDKSPYCSAACNSHSLVAIGTEEGTITLLDTSFTSKHKFQQPVLTFQPHNNALLDLQFNANDKLLATASGDQSCQIINVFTQQAVFSLKGHVSSVRQVRFQPGSNDSVIATSSRDGSIQIWDLRCGSQLLRRSQGPLSRPDEILETTKSHSANYARRFNLIDAARYMPPSSDLSTVQDKNPTQYRNIYSVTALSFLSSSNPYMLLSGSDTDATIKVWDIRMQQSHRRQEVPVTTSTPPNHHKQFRHFGVTSLVVSEDASRVYTLCKDNTVYAYSTAHLTLGSSQDLYNPHVKPYRSNPEQVGAGPIYGFRHPKVQVSSFYVKAALRKPQGRQSEMLAVGSSDTCAVLFPTDERSFPKQEPAEDGQIPIYNHGTALLGGNTREITNVSWTEEGNLLTLCDDSKCRLWRNDGDNKASRLRALKETDVAHWNYGWADVEDDSD